MPILKKVVNIKTIVRRKSEVTTVHTKEKVYLMKIKSITV